MKKKLLSVLSAGILFLIPNFNYAQAPNLGTCVPFALFTAAGQFDNTGASNVTGDVGNYVGAFNAFPPGTLNGAIHSADAVAATAAADVDVAYTSLSGNTCGAVIGVTMGNNQVLTPNVYCIGAAATLSGDLILNGMGNSNSLFIIKINGAFSTSTFANVILTNSASLCNVYWQINGQFTVGDSSVFRGTAIVNGAITLLEGSSLFGRGLSRGGAIEMHNNLVDMTMQTTPSVITAGGTTSFCAGASVSLTGNVGGVWSTGSSSHSIIVNSSGNYFVTNTTSCGSVTSNHIIVTVNPLPAASTITAGGTTTLCPGGSVVLSGNTGGTWSTGTTSSSITVTTAGNYYVTNTNSCGNSVSNHIIVTVNPSSTIAITSQPANQTDCIGGSISFSVFATGTGLTYQWRKGTVNLVNGAAISGATSSVLTINPVVLANVGNNYNVVINGTCATAVTSANATLTVVAGPVITTAPATQTVCEDASATFTVTATGAGLTYQWRIGTVNLVDGGGVSGATTSTLTINPVTTADAATTYNVVVTSSCSTTSANASLIVRTSPAIIVAPVNHAACSGASVSFSVTATGTALTYHWRKGTVNLVNGGNISGATSATLVINPAIITDIASNYNVVVTGTCTPSVTSGNVSLTLNAVTAIITAPVSQTTCVGGSVSFSVAATGTGLTYRWRKGIVNLLNGPSISGVTTATLTINPVALTNAAANYNVVISSTCSTPVTSANVSLIVQSSASITTAPLNQAVCSGSSATFSVTAFGTGITYQWRKGNVNLVNGGNISGVNTSVLIINPATATDAAFNYNLIISGTCAINDTSANVALIIRTPPVITTQPVNQTICVGDSVVFSVIATGSGLTYQWKKGTANVVNNSHISGATSSTLIINPATAADAGSYKVVVTGQCAPAVTSAIATLSINASPVIVTQPHSEMAADGGSISFTVIVTGAGLTYQWRKGTVNLVNGVHISGATTATLTINPATIVDAASNYNVVVSGICGASVASTNSYLFVCECAPSAINTYNPDNKEIAVNIFPNPFTTSFNISVSDVNHLKNCFVVIYDELGAQVMNVKITKELTVVETTTLSTGIYFYKLINNNEELQSGKLVSQK